MLDTREPRHQAVYVAEALPETDAHRMLDGNSVRLLGPGD